MYMMNPYMWLARTPGVTLRTQTLPDPEMGRWIPATDTILLDDRLTQTERRCTLVHELVHRMRGDLPGLPDWMLEHQERECEKRAAKLLIPLGNLFDALLWCVDEHEDEVADHLWVDVATLRDRLRHLTDQERHDLIVRLKESRGYE